MPSPTSKKRLKHSSGTIQTESIDQSIILYAYAKRYLILILQTNI